MVLSSIIVMMKWLFAAQSCVQYDVCSVFGQFSLSGRCLCFCMPHFSQGKPMGSLHAHLLGGGIHYNFLKEIPYVGAVFVVLTK